MASWLTQQPGRSPDFPFHNPQAEVWLRPIPVLLSRGSQLSEFSPDTKVSLSPALPAALVTTLPSYSLGSSSTARRRSGGPGPGPSLWPPQPAHLSTHCQVWAQCDPPLPSLCQPAFLLTAQNPTSDPEDISEGRWPLPSDRPYLPYPGRDEFSSWTPGSVAWEGPESWTEAGSSGEAAAMPADSNAQALALC